MKIISKSDSQSSSNRLKTNNTDNKKDDKLDINVNKTNNDKTIKVVGVLPSLVAYGASDEESHSDTDSSVSSDDMSFETATILKKPIKTCKQ